MFHYELNSTTFTISSVPYNKNTIPFIAVPYKDGFIIYLKEEGKELQITRINEWAQRKDADIVAIFSDAVIYDKIMECSLWASVEKSRGNICMLTVTDSTLGTGSVDDTSVSKVYEVWKFASRSETWYLANEMEADSCAEHNIWTVPYDPLEDENSKLMVNDHEVRYGNLRISRDGDIAYGGLPLVNFDSSIYEVILDELQDLEDLESTSIAPTTIAVVSDGSDEVRLMVVNTHDGIDEKHLISLGQATHPFLTDSSYVASNNDIRDNPDDTSITDASLHTEEVEHCVEKPAVIIPMVFTTVYINCTGINLTVPDNGLIVNSIIPRRRDDWTALRDDIRSLLKKNRLTASAKVFVLPATNWNTFRDVEDYICDNFKNAAILIQTYNRDGVACIAE